MVAPEEEDDATSDERFYHPQRVWAPLATLSTSLALPGHRYTQAYAGSTCLSMIESNGWGSKGLRNTATACRIGLAACSKAVVMTIGMFESSTRRMIRCEVGMVARCSRDAAPTR